MTEKRKISVRKVMQFLVTMIVTAGCIVAITSASKMEAGKFINNIEVQVKNENRCGFIDKEEVMNLLINDRHVDIKHIPVSQLDLHGMEQIVAANPWVGNAEIYVDNQRNLHINVNQRVPVARVFEEDGNSYYLDTALRAVPMSDRYVYYTTVVTNVPVLKDDSTGKAWKAQIVYLVRSLERDTFWNAQVSQIIMTPEHTFELVPVLGHQRILIGDTSMLQEKLANLFAFYKNVLNRIGWSRYDVIDVRYKGQVVASPSLPWNVPVDKTMSNMNWVKSIIGTDDASSTLTANTVKTAAAAIAVTATPKKIVTRPAVAVVKPAVHMVPAAKAVKGPPKPAELNAKVAKTVAKPAMLPVKGPPKPAELEKASKKKTEPAAAHAKILLPAKKDLKAVKKEPKKDEKEKKQVPKAVMKSETEQQPNKHISKESNNNH